MTPKAKQPKPKMRPVRDSDMGLVFAAILAVATKREMSTQEFDVLLKELSKAINNLRRGRLPSGMKIIKPEKEKAAPTLPSGSTRRAKITKK